MIRDPAAVIILNDYATDNGGSSVVAITSAVELARRGCPVTYFSCVGPVAPRLRGVPGLEVVCLNEPELVQNPRRLQAMASGLANGPARRALRAVLARHDPDRTVVHAHTWMKALSPAALAAVVAAGFPLVVTLHDFFITCPTGGFFEHRTGRLCRRTPLSPGCLACNCDRRNYAHKLWRSGRTFLQNRLLRIPERVAQFIGVSDFSAALLRPHLPHGAAVTVIRPPVECVDAGPAPVARNRSFVFVGRFAPEKGARLFAEAVRLTGLPAVFIGAGEDQAALQALCPAARFPGWLDAAGIRAELHQARALVFPPLWYETLGLVTVEAAAAGVPVLVANGCAATDHVRHGINGLHFSHGSVDALAGAMRRIAGDDTLAAALGQRAYRWYWDEPWTARRHVDELLAAYRPLARAVPAVAREVFA